MPQSKRQWVYAILAILGLCTTWYFNIQFMLAGHTGLLDFIKGGYANAASSSLTNDVGIAAITFLTWSFVECRRLGMRHWWGYLVLTCLIAVAFAFPLFLYIRENALHADQGNPNPDVS